MMPTTVRRRPALDSEVHSGTNNGKSDRYYDATSFPSATLDEASRLRLQSLPSVDVSVWLLVFSLFAVILLYVHSVSNTFPPAVTVDSTSAGQFVEERARKTLNDLTAFGARPVGSKANEEHAVNYLVNEITQIRKQMNVDQQSLEIDVQSVSGTFSIDFLGQFTSYYDNVNNVIAKLCPKHGSNDSLLVNCHYDTAINTTGVYVLACYFIFLIELSF